MICPVSYCLASKEPFRPEIAEHPEGFEAEK